MSQASQGGKTSRRSPLKTQSSRGSESQSPRKFGQDSSRENLKPESSQQVPINKEKPGKEDSIQDQYIKSIRYGITSIDMNLDLKRFLTRQIESKIKTTDRTEKDIKFFIKNYCNSKECGN